MMPIYAVKAIVACPRIWIAHIPRKLSLELEKPKYRRLGIRLEQISIEEVKE